MYYQDYFNKRFRNFIDGSSNKRMNIDHLVRNLSLISNRIIFKDNCIRIRTKHLHISLDVLSIRFIKKPPIEWRISRIREIDLFFILLYLLRDDTQFYSDLTKHFSSLLHEEAFSNWKPTVGEYILTQSPESSVRAFISDDLQKKTIELLQSHGFSPKVSYWGKASTGGKHWMLSKYRGKHGVGFKMIISTRWTLKHIVYFVK